MPLSVWFTVVAVSLTGADYGTFVDWQAQFGNLIFGFAVTEALGIFGFAIALILIFAALVVSFLTFQSHLTWFPPTVPAALLAASTLFAMLFGRRGSVPPTAQPPTEGIAPGAGPA